MVVESSLGRLQERFRAVNVVLAEKSTETAARTIVASVALHNLLLTIQGDTAIDGAISSPEVDCVQESLREPSEVARRSAQVKRDSIARLAIHEVT